MSEQILAILISNPFVFGIRKRKSLFISDLFKQNQYQPVRFRFDSIFLFILFLFNFWQVYLTVYFAMILAGVKIKAVCLASLLPSFYITKFVLFHKCNFLK